LTTRPSESVSSVALAFFSAATAVGSSLLPAALDVPGVVGVAAGQPANAVTAEAVAKNTKSRPARACFITSLPKSRPKIKSPTLPAYRLPSPYGSGGRRRQEFF